MKLRLNMSRTVAIALVAVASLWILSGYLLPHETPESKAAVRPNEQAPKLFRVAVIDAKTEQHSRKLTLSGRTEADHKVMAVARTGGVLTELRVKRGQYVQKNEVIAVLSDEAREAQVAQARALVAQRKAELEARRKLVMTGALPKLDLVNLESQASAAEAALTFSSSGAIGVRAVDKADAVQFVPIAVVEDDQADLWVAGIADGARVIVQGQDFVREGQKVQPIPVNAQKVSEAQ